MFEDRFVDFKFQDIFNQQMAEYRQHGMVERPITDELGDERGRSGSQLEDVVIDDEDGSASLNEFLSDIPVEAETADTTETNDTADTTETTDTVENEESAN